MNDIVLSSLLNLFALVGSRNGLDKEKSINLIEAYLKRYYGVRNPKSYLNLYTELRDFYDEFPDMDKESIIDGICSKLQSRVNMREQLSMLLSLLQFSKIGSDSFNPDDAVFRKVAENFRVGEKLYSDFTDFVQGNAGGNICVMPLAGGTLKTLFIKKTNLLLFTYEGDDVVLMNDVPVFNGIFQAWQQSGVLKVASSGGRTYAPLYYSTIMDKYEDRKPKDKVELCGRNVEFRFDSVSDIGMHDFSFNLESGQLVAIMGGSGVGKSTLLSLLNGNLRPQSGSITVNGHDISEPQAKALIGYVPQDDLLIEELTVYQNLWFTAKLCFDKMPDEELDRKVMSVLTQLGLDAAKDLKVGSPINKFISGGQRKRLNIALELIREPAILFLDEPTSGLSSTDTEKVINLLKEQTGKGKLIVVNIHQPSSDVYKLFDRLWLLDKGGYPVFDGNPIDAVSYFKTAANYADSDTSTCPTCGNVNPEIVLNIIDETRLDASGNRTDERKTTPRMWHEMYLEKRPGMKEVKPGAVPPTDQKRPGMLKQFAIFLRRNLCAKMTDLQYVIVTLMEAPLLAVICGLLTHYTPDSGVYTLMDNKNLPSFIFMAIIVCIFLGMSGSAEEIIKDRALLKREKFLNLSYRSYIWSKMIYMAGVCLVQTFLFTVVGSLIIGIHGLFWQWWLLLFVSAFVSSLIGLLLSQCLSSVVSIYITIPILLIPQILLCGLVVHFDDLNPRSETGNVPVIGDVIPSRWAYEALAVSTFSMNDYEGPIYELDGIKFTCQYYKEVIYELKSQLETIQDEIHREGEADPVHMEIIKKGIARISDACAIDVYEGDGSYDSLMDWLDSANNLLDRWGNSVTLRIDEKLTSYIREHDTESLQKLKRDNYNIQLENFVLNRNARKAYSVIGTSIVPRSGYIFLKPQSRTGRAPFYSGVKIIGNREIPTYTFNVIVLLLMSLLLSVCLLEDVPGKYVRKEKN